MSECMLEVTKWCAAACRRTTGRHHHSRLDHRKHSGDGSKTSRGPSVQLQQIRILPLPDPGFPGHLASRELSAVLQGMWNRGDGGLHLGGCRCCVPRLCPCRAPPGHHAAECVDWPGTQRSRQCLGVHVSGMQREDLRGVETYLGRPWQPYARVIFIHCHMDAIVHPLWTGWLPWNNNVTATRTVFFAEFENQGPGADVRGRVNWAGFHNIKKASKAAKFTVNNFIDGGAWLPETGVPYKGGLWWYISPLNPVYVCALYPRIGVRAIYRSIGSRDPPAIVPNMYTRTMRTRDVLLCVEGEPPYILSVCGCVSLILNTYGSCNNIFCAWCVLFVSLLSSSIISAQH